MLSYETLQFETEIVKRSRKPTWGKEFSFPITDVRSSFNVSLFDNGLTGDHELIGSIAVGVNEVLRNSALDQQPWYKVFRTNEYGRLRPNGEVQLRLQYQANSRAKAAHQIPTVAAPRTIRSTMRTMRQMRRQVAAMQDIRLKALVAELTDAQRKAKQEQGAVAALEMMQSNSLTRYQASCQERGKTLELCICMLKERDHYQHSPCVTAKHRLSLPMAHLSVVPQNHLSGHPWSDDDDAVFALTTKLSMTSAEDYLRVEIIGIEASRQAQVCPILLNAVCSDER